MLTQYIDNIISVGSAIVGGVSGWLLGRRKRNAEANTSEAGALAAMQSAYDKFVEDVHHKFDKMEKHILAVEKELEDCKKANL